MEESTVIANENIYEGVLYDLGYCYDKYDVQGASTGLSNEPWDLVTYPDPANPDSLERRYDAVIWFTSRFDEYTVLDTMQCRLVDFVRKGGNLSGHKLATSALRRLLKEYSQAAGLGDGAFHDLRRTCARNSYDNGAPLLQVQRLLGHADPKTTARYIGLDQDDSSTAVDFVRY